MERSVAKPPETPDDLANLIGGTAPTAPAGNAKAKAKPAPKQLKTPEKMQQAEDVAATLPNGRMGDKCKREGCKGKLTDLSRCHIAKTPKAKGKTLITLICNNCNQVQAQANIPDLD